MKQLIVLIAMIILGIAIGVLIMGFSSTAERIKNKTDEKITNTVDGWLASRCHADGLELIFPEDAA